MTEATGIRKNGERFPVEITSAFFIDTDGIRKTSTMVSNISERKQAEQSVIESEQRYKMFVQQSTEGIWRIDIDKPIPVTTPVEEMIDYCYNHAWIAECNDNFARMYGFEKAEQMIGMPLNKILPADNPENMQYFFRFFTNGFKVENEISYEKDKNGNQLILLNNMVGIVERDHIKRAWGTQRNITPQKKAEEALAESENRLRTIIQTDPECIKLLNRDCTILEMNPAGLAMVQADSMEQVIGKNCYDIMLPEYHKEFTTLVARVFEGGEGKLVFRIRGLKGKLLWMETHCVPFRNATGEITALLSVTRDITEKILLENSLNEERRIRHKQITEAVITGQEKERLQLGEELHDNINQILASTKLYLECALKAEHPRADLVHESRELVEKAMTEIRKLSKTLLPPSLGEVGLLQALNELADNIRQVNELSISVSCKDVNENELSTKIKLTIFRIVQEQLNNIIKHAEAKNIVISIVKSGDALQVTVSDDGKGFDPAQKKNGVGLRNISSRAEVNNGTARIDSKPGEGCTLSVCFPLDKILSR